MKLPVRFEKYYLLALVYVPLLAAFWALERFIEPRYTVYFFIDSYIPYIPAFVIFYFVWFIYMFLATAYFMLFSKRDFIRLTAFMAIGMASCYLIYIIFPNGQPLRPQEPGGGVFGSLVTWLYSIDSPTNVCPSIHVINTLGVHFSVCGSVSFRNNKAVKLLSLVTAILINLSTVFIKQHSILDVLLGIAFAFMLNYFFERKIKREHYQGHAKPRKYFKFH